MPNGSSEGISNTLYIRNNGDGDLTWSASSNQPWLVLDATTGQAPYNLPVGILPAGLTQGLHTAEIAVTAGDQHDKIAVEVEIGAVLHVAPEGLRFEVFPGQSIVRAESIAIFNSDESVGDWSASSNQPWLQLSAPSGKTPASLEVSVNPAGLALGEYTGEIRIQAGNQSHVIQVTLGVQPSTIAQPGHILLPAIRK